MASIVMFEDADHPIGAEGVLELARTGALAGVHELVLRDQAIGIDGLRTVLETVALAELVVLELAGCDLGGDAVVLAETSELAKLERLGLGFNSIPPDALCRIVTAPHWGSLEQLNLSMNGVDASVCEAIAQKARFDRLTTLVLNDSMADAVTRRAMLDDEAVEWLARATTLGRLQTLALGWNPITDRGAFALAGSRSRSLPALHTLFMEGTRVGPDGIRALERLGLDELVVDRPPRRGS
jgi:hypothetical protein